MADTRRRLAWGQVPQGLTTMSKEIREYYDRRMAELTALGVAIPNDLERIGVLLLENKALRERRKAGEGAARG